MSETQMKIFTDSSELSVEVLPAFQGVLGRQVDIVVTPPVSAEEWDTLVQSNPIFSQVTDVFEGQSVTRFRLLGEAVDTREEFGIELKQGLMAVRGIDAICGETQSSRDTTPKRDEEGTSLACFQEQLKRVCLEEYAKMPRTVEGFSI